MKGLALDNQGDLVIENGDLKLLSGVDELKQAIWITLSVNINEWFLNNYFGLDYSVFMQDDFNQLLIEQAIIRALLQDVRIKQASISSVKFDSRKRRVFVIAYVIDYEDNYIDLREVIELD